MVSHFFRVFARSIFKNAGHSAINIFGLILGMTACMLICLYVAYEKSYDEFHADKNNIYRVRHDRYTNHQLTRQFAAGPMGIGDDLKSKFPEVIRFVRLNPGTSRTVILSNGDERFREDRVYFASEDLFRIFSYELVQGVDSLVLRDPFTMVVSESLARKYFGDADPIGKLLKANGKEEYTITGVFKDTPGNTHLKFDALFSFASLHKILGPTETQDLMTNWGWEGNWTYVELMPGTDIRRLSEKVQMYVDRETEEFSKTYNEQMSFVFQPLTSIHLNSDLKMEVEAGGSEGLIDFLAVIAGFILLISWINYVNLSTAKSIERAREVGIRKILGTARERLVIQFILESFLLKLFAFVITFSAVAILLPYFSAFVERDLSMQIFTNTNTWLVIAAVFVTGVVCSGLYPALVMSGFKPAVVLKGNFKTSHKGTNLRRGLVTFQFVASIVLITGTVAMYSQVQFMRERPLGMNEDNVLVIEGPGVHENDRKPANKLMHELLAPWPFVQSTTTSSDVPGHAVRSGTGSVRLEGEPMENGNAFRTVQCDEDFLKSYDLTLVAGRNFTNAKNEEWKSVLVNETGMKLLGISDPAQIIGKNIYVWGEKIRVVGVVKDYHHESLKQKVDQLVFVCDREASDYISIKFTPDADLQQLLSTAEKAFNTAYPENTFHYFFMSDYFQRQYKAELAFNRLTGMFAILATLISCLGLFGLSSYMITQRTKEIGIRKVLGATAQQIVTLMSKEYLVIILAANVVAWPLSWLLMKEWLNGFAYRIDPSVFIYLVPGLCALLIAIATIASQSIRAAAENPVKSLRNE
jgi:putative ABC transport system permease protein